VTTLPLPIVCRVFMTSAGLLVLPDHYKAGLSRRELVAACPV
jgi:hypothetical protein